MSLSLRPNPVAPLRVPFTRCLAALHTHTPAAGRVEVNRAATHRHPGLGRAPTRQRAINKWRRHRRRFITSGATYGYRLSAEDRPFQKWGASLRFGEDHGYPVDDSWWFQEGRFNKLKHDCHMCRAYSASRKWRVQRAAERRRLNRLDESAW